jgi:hypothetical protein
MTLRGVSPPCVFDGICSVAFIDSKASLNTSRITTEKIPRLRHA